MIEIEKVYFLFEKLIKIIISPEVFILILFIMLERYWHIKQEKEFEDFKDRVFFYLTHMYKISQDSQDYILKK